MYVPSTLTVTAGSSLVGNAATVSSPASLPAPGSLLGRPKGEPTLNRCERDTLR